MAESSVSKGVRFVNVRAAYPSAEEIVLKLVADKSLARTSRDWAGIFRVGFASSRDYFTFQWVPLTAAEVGKEYAEVTVTFTARSIPAEDGNFYQFAYVANNGSVVAVSDAFHIGVPLEGDPEFIEIPSTDGMESMLMIDTEASTVKKQLDEQHKENGELRTVVESLKKRLSSKEEEKVARDGLLEEALGDKRELSAQLEKSEQVIAELRQESLDKDVQIEALQREFEDFSRKFKEELEGVEAEKELVKAENAALRLQLTSTNEQQKTEVGELQSELVVMRLQLTDQQTRFEEMNKRGVTSEGEATKKLQLQEQALDQLSAEKTAREFELEETRQQMRAFSEQLSTKEAEIIGLKEELANSQANVAELVGAGPNDRPTVRNVEGVDPEAHEALRSAFEKMQTDKAALTTELFTLRPEVERLRQRESELTRKLELGKEEFTKKATEAMELNKQLKRVQESMLVVSTNQEEVEDLTKQLNTARSELARLEAEVEDMSSTQELAVQELTQRKQEGKEKDLCIAQLEDALQRTTEVKDLRIAELEDALQLATEEHRKLEAEIMMIEERTDRKIHDKNGEITILRDQLQEMEAVLDQERKEVVDLREGLRLRQESIDVQQRQQQPQQGQQAPQPPQYQMPYQPPQPNAPYVHPYAPPPIRYPAQAYPPAQRPAPTPGQPSAPPAPVPAPAPAPAPAPRADEGQCPICHKNFAKNQLQTHVNGHFDN